MEAVVQKTIKLLGYLTPEPVHGGDWTDAGAILRYRHTGTLRMEAIGLMLVPSCDTVTPEPVHGGDWTDAGAILRYRHTGACAWRRLSRRLSNCLATSHRSLCMEAVVQKTIKLLGHLTPEPAHGGGCVGVVDYGNRDSSRAISAGWSSASGRLRRLSFS